MADIQYDLRYLPLFYEDLEQKAVYIAEQLHNEKAANDLLDAVENAITERLPNDEGPKKIMEVRRFLYNKQDCEQLI